jgi:hypothetical protein
MSEYGTSRRADGGWVPDDQTGQAPTQHVDSRGRDGVEGVRMLLDDFMPECDVRTSHATRIDAPPERVYACLRTADLDHWGLTRALYALRALAMFAAALAAPYSTGVGERLPVSN